MMSFVPRIPSLPHADWLRGSITALATPFKNGRVDEDALVFLCERQIERGTKALLVGSTTGEAPTLRHAEKLRLIELVVATADRRVPVIAGTVADCTQTAVDLVREAERLGADAILAAVPLANRPTQDGLFQHFRAIQTATDLSILLLDAPHWTGSRLSFDTVERLADLPNIVGLADTCVDQERTRSLRRLLGREFLLLSGDDRKVLAMLAAGGDGAISSSANVIPAICTALHIACGSKKDGRFGHLRDVTDRLNQALAVETDPIPVKWALARLGLIGGELRLPLTPLPARHEETIYEALDAVIDLEAAIAAERPKIERHADHGPPLSIAS
jgi:4-hydroxy-tetrahydrodipicolinate synthase